jgi:hypothetical protein
MVSHDVLPFQKNMEIFMEKVPLFLKLLMFIVMLVFEIKGLEFFTP